MMEGIAPGAHHDPAIPRRRPAAEPPSVSPRSPQGELLTDPGDHPLNPGRRTHTVVVLNSGGRPIQVGSHYHFAQTNGALQFDRTAAHGMRLNIASGMAMRFERRPAVDGGKGRACQRARSLGLPSLDPGKALARQPTSGGPAPRGTAPPWASGCAWPTPR